MVKAGMNLSNLALLAGKSSLSTYTNISVCAFVRKTLLFVCIKFNLSSVTVRGLRPGGARSTPATRTATAPCAPPTAPSPGSVSTMTSTAGG